MNKRSSRLRIVVSAFGFGRRTLAALVVALALGAPVVGSGAQDDLSIAFLMPCSTCADRFENNDKPEFVAAVAALAPEIEVIANNAQGSSATQLAQAEAALTNGADVIVVSPLDEAAGAAIVEKARAEEVPIVSYDGLITGAETDYYVSFENEEVGALQAQYLADSLEPGATVVMINGAQDIAPGRQFKAGAHRVLDPLFADGTLTLGFEGDAQQFDPANGQRLMEQALTQLEDRVDGVLVANDGLAGAVVTALTARDLNGDVLVTGQDATDAGLQRVILGDQTMTVYKPIRDEAAAAAAIAVALAQGNPADADALAIDRVDNGVMEVPSVLLDPVVVTRETIAETVIADGFTSLDRLCTDEVAAACDDLRAAATPTA